MTSRETVQKLAFGARSLAREARREYPEDVGLRLDTLRLYVAVLELERCFR